MIILGLVGSGKSTLYRVFNEEKTYNAVEIELPQSCIDDEKLKRKLFDLYYNNKNIDCIITHPYFLPKNIKFNKEDQIEILDIPFKERLERIKKRSNNMNSKCKIFPIDFLLEEEDEMNKWRTKYPVYKEKENDTEGSVQSIVK